MKFRALLIAVFFSAWSFGQTPILSFRITDENTEFSQKIPAGTVLLDMTALKQYLTLVPLPTPTVKTIKQCEKLLTNNSNTLTAQLKEINVNSSAHQIGDLYGGGIIVAVWSENGKESGLIASLTDLTDASSNPYFNWAGTFYNANPALPDPIDPTLPIPEYKNGKIPCDAVTDPDGAIFMCQSYTGSDGSGGWYLPAEMEMWAMYCSADIINEILPTADNFKYLNSNYWTSTEDGATAGNALSFAFANGIYSKSNKSTNGYLVRAVKRF